MIVPTPRAIQLTALAAPVGLALGVLAPAAWIAAPLWIMGVLVLIVADAVLAKTPVLAMPEGLPATLNIGETFTLGSADVAAAFDGPVERTAPGSFRAERRGKARLRRLWARQAGPMGLAWRQASAKADRDIPVLPDIRPVRDQGMRQYLNSLSIGNRMRRDHGDGQDFQVLTDFQAGMERRSIDWKASARHASLLAREFHTERDNMIVFAVDAGRAMTDPVGDVPRVDRAVSSALLAAFVALKSGDRVRLYSFGARPQVDSGSIGGGTRGFARLHHAAADIDYGVEESNYTLGLVTLDQKLDRRALVVLFTEFTDTTSAELLLAAAQRMLKRHRVLFVLFRDVELEALRDAEPAHADDLVRADVAHLLLRDRAIVVERLRRMGIDVIEATADAMPLALVERYLTHRERGR
ncbi:MULTISPECIES: DUF58 domain-containing protein [unclassified Sphingomonas]|uniref:DUF58 domain-containing protein n=1 Tax=unclassified Sphingomonas TaxID=196159 RepID=UPI0006FB5D90|nr:MULTISPECIES: DUF58 domain-containing protein [unclassified Sphingomonas]KQM61555.1 hypothetical protein ASE65_08530 [Sphingomonas sp. Leaf16]KQN12651.1 hypothetical protein ASE81_09540 [Sphingomonas sp. Leaf29]KQN19130.1 hypothetical protein ASE83_09465 [Sphingomonas sp. Leaf32]